MDKLDIYADIAERCGGDIYIGVVGPVRSGKSTFIKRFMDTLILPNIADENERARATDELPQSADGRAVMTTEPKFIPKEAVEITIGDGMKLKVRMIDCVGFITDGAQGYTDGDRERLVNTPWSSKPVSFTEAAETGTRKVICDHSTIGIVVTTDGSVTELERENYEKAEERVINELKAINKPFVVVLNTSKPFAKDTEELKERLENKYNTCVLPMDCSRIKEEDITEMLEKVLYEFPVMETAIDTPLWFDALDNDHWLKKAITEYFIETAEDLSCLKTVKTCLDGVGNEYIKRLYLDNIDMGTGKVSATLKLNDELFYRILTETIGMDVKNDKELIEVIKTLTESKRVFDKYERAITDADTRGYGIVTPTGEGVKLEKPELFKQGNRYGVRLKAKGETIHVIKTDVETRLEPVIGTEEESRRFLEKVIRDYEADPEKMLDLDIFGRKMETLINEGMYAKIYNIPEDTKTKLKTTLQKILNEGNGSIICIIL